MFQLRLPYYLGTQLLAPKTELPYEKLRNEMVHEA